MEKGQVPMLPWLEGYDVGLPGQKQHERTKIRQNDAALPPQRAIISRILQWIHCGQPLQQVLQDMEVSQVMGIPPVIIHF